MDELDSDMELQDDSDAEDDDLRAYPPLRSPARWLRPVLTARHAAEAFDDVCQKCHANPAAGAHGFCTQCALTAQRTQASRQHAPPQTSRINPTFTDFHGVRAERITPN